MIRRRSIRAFTLTEILFVLSLMGVAGLVSTQLFRASIRSIDAARTAEDRLTTLNHVAAAMRRDVWGASAIDMPDPRTIILSRPDGPSIRWSIADDSVVRSTGDMPSQDDRRWRISVPLEIQREGPAVILRSNAKQSDQNGEWRFFSAMMIAAIERNS